MAALCVTIIAPPAATRIIANKRTPANSALLVYSEPEQGSLADGTATIDVSGTMAAWITYHKYMVYAEILQAEHRMVIDAIAELLNTHMPQTMATMAPLR